MASEIASSAPAHAAIEVNPRARFEIMAAIMLALFLGALDQTIVGPVLPRISTQLNGADLYTWVVTSYLVTSTAAIPLYGKLSDYFGRKPMLLIGIVLFLIGSVLSGLSQTMWELIAFRGLQGIGAGALFPISLAVIGDLFTPAERGKYQGLFGGVFGVAFLIGPFLGGFLTDNLSWHWIFFVNVPVGLISLYLIGRLLPMVHPKGARLTLDLVGVITFVCAVVPVLIALTLAETTNWLDPSVLVWFGVGVVFLVAFIVAEARAADPMIPLDLFRNRTFAVSAVATFFAVFGFSILIIFLPLWFQIVKGESTTASGYLLFPFLFGLIFSSVAAGLIVSRTGRYKVLLAVGLIFMGVGVYLFQNLRADTSFLALSLWMLIAGLGVGPTMAIFTLIVQNDVPFERLGTATSDLTLFRQIGTSVGLTMAFTLFRENLTWDSIRSAIVTAGAPSSAVPATAPAAFDPNQLISVGGSVADAFAQLPAELRAPFATGFYDAFSLAIANSVWLGVLASVVSFLAVLALKEKPLRAHFHAEQAARAGLQGSTGTPGSSKPGLAE
ncbi:MAG TPA: MDR family MFS transporter [Candidatus Limnocylindrales bacterium]|jgi:EmrB/QacA subfamily drug resistance transporter